MPNWITNQITAPKHVIEAIVSPESGRVDFNLVAPFPGPHNDWDGISCSAEEAAEIVIGKPLSENPVIATFERQSRKDFDIRKLNDECFKQFVGMLENYRACGYLHSMDFARKVWGTKWNACESSASPEEGKASFDTAWSRPEGVLRELSKRFPDDVITVTFADEDIGSNCGTFSLKAGETIESDIAPRWDALSDSEKEKWKAFAYQVKGWQPEPDEAA